MNNSSFLISICIPTYNGEKYLSETLDSIKSQSYKNFEVVISDDNSTDDTESLILNFIKEVDFHVTFIKNNTPGIGSNWNNCINNSRGELIKFIFQDDLLTNDCLKEMIIPFESNNIGFSFCNKTLIGKVSDNDQIKTDLNFERSKTQSSKDILLDKNLFNQPRNKIGEPPCILFNKSIFKETGLYNTSLKQALDYEIYYRILKKYEIRSVDKKLVKFRVHSEQATNKNSKMIIIDSYLLPLLIIKNHFNFIHLKVKITVLYKYFSGLFRYFILKRL